MKGLFRFFAEMFGDFKWFFMLIAIIITAALYFSGALGRFNLFYSGGLGHPYAVNSGNGSVQVQPTLCQTMTSTSQGGTVINVASYSNSEQSIDCPDNSNVTTEDLSFVTPNITLLCMEDVAGLGTKINGVWVRHQIYPCADLATH